MATTIETMAKRMTILLEMIMALIMKTVWHPEKILFLRLYLEKQGILLTYHIMAMLCLIKSHIWNYGMMETASKQNL